MFEEREKSSREKIRSLGERESDVEEGGSQRWLVGASLLEKVAAHFPGGGGGGREKREKREEEEEEED